MRLESIPELSMSAASLHSLQPFSVAELKDSGLEGSTVSRCLEDDTVEETVVYFNTDSGLALVEGGEPVTIEAVMGEGGQVIELLPLQQDMEA